MYPRNGDNSIIKKWTSCDKHYFIVARLKRGGEIMAKVVSFTDYKNKKLDKKNSVNQNSHKNKYLEAYKNMDEEKRKMLNGWLLDEM
ncbi:MULTISPECIES: hypothetical protein [unclassified Clostridium]|uniref:hypothetical protein n=1 Tax=unclassified Clostridium TaxID=2614128 RepID=UPI0025BA6B07|nr:MULTISPECIES: hypothetical protein [unclassified Clostridium]